MFIVKADTLPAPQVSHGFFGRRGGVSEGVYQSLNCGPGSGDLREAVLENRRRALHAFAPSSRLVTMYQIHSAECLVVTQPWEIAANPRADAMATDRPGIALGILTADCAPVLLCDQQAGVIGAAHAGWQGALAGVTDALVRAMVGLGATTEHIRAAIGPSIGAQAYEVGPEFEARFVTADRGNVRFFSKSPESARSHFDLPGYVAFRLERAAIHSVELIGRCTYREDENFFSYRRTTHRKEPDYGRQLSAIALSN